MSKITNALEKAARERLRRQQEPATASAGPVAVAVATAVPGEVVRVSQAQVDPHIVSLTDPHSPIAEQYRILRTNLRSLKSRGSCTTLVVTSAVHNEGKSVTAINLAVTVARQESLRVALVDGDLRKGSLHTWLGLEERQGGFSTSLTHGGELNGSLVRLAHPPLSVLPAGPAVEHPAELLGSSNMQRLLATLKAQYDLIIMDAPPVLAVADPGILAAQADGVLLVIRAGKTQCKTVLQAHALLRQMRATVLGCILTSVEHFLSLSDYRYHRAYRYGAKSPGSTEDAGA